MNLVSGKYRQQNKNGFRRGLFSHLWMVCLSLLHSCSNGGFVMPETRETADGWVQYVDSRKYYPEDAQNLDPEPVTPEAAVVKYTASWMRGDSAWLESLAPREDWDSRLQRKIDAWRDWNIRSFQLRRKKELTDTHLYLEVYLEVEFKGEVDSGFDEFEVVKSGDRWMILYPPT